MIDERMKLLAGQRLVAGFEGYTVPESFQKLIRDCKIGNVILFRRNIQSAEQLRDCAEVQYHSDIHAQEDAYYALVGDLADIPQIPTDWDKMMEIASDTAAKLNSLCE